MFGNWIDKIQYKCISICIIFFRDRSCHVSSTAQPAEKYLPALIRIFRQKGFETLAAEVVSVSHSNHWGRVDDKYMWRYLMHAAGFRIVNQDGSFFEDVDAQTLDRIKDEALKHYEFLSHRPALSLIAAESKRRRSPFLPRQAVQRLLRGASHTLRYNHIERVVLGLEMVPEACLERVNFRKGRVMYAKGASAKK